MNKPAIIFDFGNVLIDWNPYYLYQKLIPGGAEATGRYLKEIHFVEWNYLQDQGRSFAEAVPMLCEQYPHYADLIRAYDERYEETIIGSIAGTVEILWKLKQAGYPLVGLSNWPAEKFHIVRPKYDFFGWFDHIVISGEVKMAKPDPRIFIFTLEAIGRSAAECVFIDDSAKNIKAADQFGFVTIHFMSPPQLAEELQARGLLPA